jgi:hypothetical protein
LVKLIIFSVTLGILPIGSYFFTLNYVWKGIQDNLNNWQDSNVDLLVGDSTSAAITAIVAANVLLAAYIITAVLEDRTSTTSGNQPLDKETRKDK